MIQKLDMATPNFTDNNIQKVAELFPNCLTEKKDEDGNLTHAIDFELLKQELSQVIVEGNKERYSINWPGKKEALLKANEPINKTLRPDRETSVNFDTTQNLYIEGDNLEALKLLQKSYLGEIKMIYIDPPYNTGNDFVYKDNFTRDKEQELQESGQIDEEGGRLVANLDSNGRYHSDWLSMMYPRLKLARNLLKDDGVIFISIDDNEVTNLKKICDEIWGEGNFIAQIIRNTNSSKNQSLFVSVSHEYCLLYSKDMETLKIKHKNDKWSVPKNNVDEYVKKVKQLQKEGLTPDEITEELKTLTKYPRFIDFTNYWYFDDNGLYRKDNLGGVKDGNSQPLFNPITKDNDPVPPGGYRYNAEKLKNLTSENRIHFHTDGSLPTIKRYLHENMNQRPKSIMSDDQRPDYTMMTEFNTPFDNPKQLSFMKRILSLADQDSIFLDFFSGSATTAHAVMKLNSEDNGNRKFILVQIPELTDEKGEAFKAGYKNICEIGKKRIRKAGKKILEENKDKEGIENLDIGFRVLKVDSSNMKDVYYTPDETSQKKLPGLVDNVKEDRTSEDLLFQVLLDSRVSLSDKIAKETIQNKEVYFVDDNELVACFDDSLDEEFIRELADNLKDKDILKVVFKDSGFGSDSLKDNVEQIFKQLCPNTEIYSI